MSKATAATYEWLYQEFTDGVGETWLCVSFVRDLSPEEALQRINVIPGSPLVGEGFGVAACSARGGTVLIEQGWGGIVHNESDILSEGSSAAAVHVTINRADFAYYEDGRLITTFGLYSYRYREGTDPDRLAADVVELGMAIDGDEPGINEPTSAALALAERATGVHLPRAGYGQTALVGSTEHLYPYV
ncbi:DUF6461 domain-containing protein [Nonomuraea recticatena]|uniref:Uncharacterized protein n=1 Tax=Nonomuraea recticatena TaxID=46178 RepID=A0ABP6FBQ4_9ACTN